MEAVTAGASRRAEGTGSKTIADLLPLAVEKYGDTAGPALQGRRRVGRHLVRGARRGRQGGRPRADRPRHRARRQGLDPGPHAARVDPGVLRHPHRRRHPGHDLPDQLAGGVPVRPRATPTRARSSSRTPSSSRRSARSRTDCPELEHVIVMDPAGADLGDALSLDAAPRARPRPRRVRVARRATRPSPRRTSASTSTRPAPPARPRAACSRTRNYRAITDAVVEDSAARGRRLRPTSSCRSRTRSRS